MKTLFASALLALAFATAPASAQKADAQNVVKMETTKGPVTIQLRPDLAPKHVERIKQLVQDGYYDNVPFHRVIEGFMAQTGDGQRGDGTGKSKYPDLAAEFTKTPFKRGVVGMARSQSLNSANSQFFIMLAESPHLAGQYTVVGQVTSGMDVIDKIKKGPPAQNGAVTDPDRIVRMQLASGAK